jgi:hypothetical protein
MAADVAWFAQNNAYGGVNCVQALECPSGHIPVTPEQVTAIMSAPPGSTIDGSGNVVSPATPIVPISQQAASIACRAIRNVLFSGFPSSALGAAHTYPSSEADQRNLAIAGVAALAGSSVSLWCADASANWAFTAHTAAQVIQVVKDFNSFRAAQSATLVSGS